MSTSRCHCSSGGRLLRILQALGIAQYAIAFMGGDAKSQGTPSAAVLDRTNLFFVDACLCGASALALKTNSPTVLRNEALMYPMEKGATLFGSSVRCTALPHHCEEAFCISWQPWIRKSS